MEEKVKSEAEAPAADKNGKCTQNSDFRTFLIAFLTTVILLALYHFGMGVSAILSGSSSYQTMPVTREFVLVPVNALPQRGPGMGMGPRHHFRPHGEFRHGKFRRGLRPNDEAPEKPAQTSAPAVQAPAVQAPAVQAPAVQAPAVQAPAVQAPAVQAPAAK